MKSRILRQLIYEYPERARRFILVLASLYLPMILGATNWNSSEHFLVTADECTGKVNVSFMVFKNGDDADYNLETNINFFLRLDNANVQLGLVQAMNNNCEPLVFLPIFPIFDFKFTRNPNGTVITTPIQCDYTSDVGDGIWINLEFPPQQNWIGQDIGIRVIGEIDDDGPNTYVDWTKTVSFDEPSPPINVSASSDNCNGITVSWQNGNGFPGSCNNGEVVVYRDGIGVQPLSASHTSWTDYTMQPGVSHNYTIKSRYNYGGIFNTGINFSSTATGTRKGPGEPPNNVQANGDCEDAINLSWDWNESNPTNFKVYRDNAYLTTVSGSQRTYEDASVSGGTNYLYEITSTNECGEGSKSDSDGATITASPQAPADLSSQAEPGVGIRVNWIEPDYVIRDTFAEREAVNRFIAPCSTDFAASFYDPSWRISIIPFKATFTGTTSLRLQSSTPTSEPVFGAVLNEIDLNWETIPQEAIIAQQDGYTNNSSLAASMLTIPNVTIEADQEYYIIAAKPYTALYNLFGSIRFYMNGQYTNIYNQSRMSVEADIPSQLIPNGLRGTIPFEVTDNGRYYFRVSAPSHASVYITTEFDSNWATIADMQSSGTVLAEKVVIPGGYNHSNPAVFVDNLEPNQQYYLTVLMNQQDPATMFIDYIGPNGAYVTSLPKTIVPNSGYFLERSLIGGAGTTTIEVDGGNTTTYLDEDVNPCISYQYKIKAKNECDQVTPFLDSTTVTRLEPDLSSTFAEEALLGSKGYYPNRVELNWSVDVNETFLTGYKVYRKIAGSDEDSVVVASLESGSNIYIDNFVDAGTLYEYTILGESQCEDSTIYSNISQDIGFRSPFGTVTGQITYGNGTAVKDVKVTAESTTEIAGKSLYFYQEPYLEIKPRPNQNPDNELLVEAWVKPLSFPASATIVQKSGAYDLYYDGGEYKFNIIYNDMMTETVSISDTIGLLNNYFHIAGQLHQDTLKMFVNGEEVAAKYVAEETSINASTMPIIIGENFHGNIDELRIWHKGKPNDELERDHTRLMVGSEAGLNVYLRMNENTGNYAYDISKDGNIFNRNHAKFVGDVEWREDIPTTSQLGIVAYTDEAGNYVMSVPYNGVGESFVITPAFGIHEFDPSTRALYIGDGSFIHNNVDFEDKSSFRVTGTVFYKGTSCPAKDVFVKVDNEIVVENNEPVKTNDMGEFEVAVPIGSHFISVERQGHGFSVGRFPESGTYNFQEDLAGVEFIDSTLIKVVGRVVGGLREGSKKVNGLETSNNNIGTAQIRLKAQLGNGCIDTTFTTDATTGEYEVSLPPLKYIPTVTIPSNQTIDFGTLELVNLTDITQLTTLRDTTFNSDNQVVSIDSVSYHKQLDYIHREDATIAVLDPDGENSFIGETTYEYTDANGITNTVDLRTNPFRWPLFKQKGDDDLYRCMIKVFEQYLNYDNNVANPVRDSVPTTDGKLVFNNELSEFGQLVAASETLPAVEVEMNKINTKDTLKSLVYSFKAGEPNFLVNSSIPEYSFTRKMEITLITSTGQAISWLPVTNPPTGGDGIFRGYLLGKISKGEQYVTNGPQVPEYVLRDPPGSGSSASRELGTSKTQKRSYGWEFAGSGGTSDKIMLGTNFSAGIGVSTKTEIKNDLTFGISNEIKGGRQGTQSITRTNTQTWQTNSASEEVGAGSDLYIGKSHNVQFGVSEELALVPEALCDNIECLDSEGFNEYRFAKKYGLSIVPRGYETNFMFSELHIKNYLIPNLTGLRNTILQSNDKYTSHLPISSPYYGSNNDDEVFSNDNDPNTNPSTDGYHLTGPSYTYTATSEEDQLTGDSVRIVNQQIHQWENAIRTNEWEKVNVGKQEVRDSLKLKALNDLFIEYDSIDCEDILSGNIEAAALGIIISAVPFAGAAIVGYPIFGATAADQIAGAYQIDECNKYLLAQEQIEEKFSQASPVNYSLSSGINFTNAITHESASEYTNKVEFGMSASFKAEVEAKISNTGGGFEKEIKLSVGNSREWGTASSSSEQVSFTLYEPNEGDYFSVDVYPSILGWGPIFKRRPGGATSCPHEPADSTDYYMDDNGNPYVLAGHTFQRENPTVTSAPSLITNVPVGSPATFNLTLGNESESGDDWIFAVKLLAASNPFGAVVKVDGGPPNFNIAIPAGTQINKVVSVEKGPGEVYNYDSLKFVIHSTCQYAAGTINELDIADETYISAHFLPACTNLGMASPEPQWVLNNSFNDTMPVSIIDYDINFFDLERLRVDYKPSSESNWTTLQSFYKDTGGDPSLEPIPNSPFTLYEWDVAQIPDGNYDLRVVSKCLLAEQSSATHSGVMDRVNPHAFGSPSPSDGILDIGDDIAIRFNEPVEFGSLTSQNFDIRGVLNGSEVNHSTSLYFDGTDDHLNITANLPLQDRDFTIEFAARRDGTGEQAIFTQGAQADESLFIGFNAANKFVCRINGNEVASTDSYTDNEWRYYAVSYNHTAETVELFVADQNTNALVNSGNTTLLADHIGSGSSHIGGSTFDASQNFKGNIHDLRIWTLARSLSEFNVTKSTMLSGTEIGLLANWRMDEAEGNTAKEHVRRRDANLTGGTIWEIDPSGNAAEFNGTDNYLKIGSGDVVVTDEMDFTLEFWFNSTQTGAGTLFSNGSAEAANSDGIYSWNIYKDASGNIHVKHNGIDYIATNENYFDGQWHHFSLVFQRIGNTSVYIDGNLEDVRSSDNFEQFGGSHVYLGAKGYMLGVNQTVESHFQGKIDEFRIWNLARKADQVRRDKRNRMRGDEPGLLLYMSFENYELDPTGIPILTETFDEQIDLTDTLHTVEENGTTLIDDTPTIKLQRPVQQIAFSYSVNNDEIILTPTTQALYTEDVTLDITVEGVKDLHGNAMESPVTWIAFMDRNPVVWQEESLEYEKPTEAEFEATTTIINRGGQVKIFEILNIPDWLTVSPTSGSITPNSTMEVELSVNPLLNVGRYFADLQLLTDYGYPEVLPIDMRVIAEEPDWVVDPSQYDGSMGIIGVLDINGAISADTEDRLAAFVDDEARGAGYVQYVSSIDAYLVFLDVYGESGETLKFKIWDASTGIIYSNVEPLTLDFENNTLIGDVSNPQVFSTGSQIDFDIELSAGWNWMTYFLDPTDPMDLNTLLGSINAQSGDIIKYIEDFSDYSQTSSAWEGALNNLGLHPENLYKIRVTESDTLTLIGDLIDPTTRQIDLVNNWNWLGFISVRNQDTEQALGDLVASQGDVIKGQSQFAIYDEQLGWLGSLETMVTGRGYMYKSDGSKSFTYPIAGYYKNTPPEVNEFTHENWLVDYKAYSSNMTAIYKIDGECLEEFEDTDFAVGVFDENGTPRGLSPLTKLENDWVTFLTFAGEGKDNLQLRLLNTYDLSEYETGVTVEFKGNGHIGELRDMEVLNMGEILCKTQEEDMNFSRILKVYPSVFDNEFTIEFGNTNDEGEAMIELFDVQGRSLLQQEVQVNKGLNVFNINTQQLNLPAGAYYVNFMTGNTNENAKLIKQ